MVDIHKIIKIFFKDNLSDFSLTEEYSHFRYWSVVYSKNDIQIKINEEIGIIIYIVIENTEYSLWQYDRTVIEKSNKDEEDILYQLNILKKFLNEVGYQ